MWQTNILTAIFLIFIGYMIKKYKMSYLIAGYNTSSKQEKSKYDEEKLVNYIGNLLIKSSTVLILGSLASITIKTQEQTIITSSWILFTIILLAGVIHLNITDVVKKQKIK